MKVWRTDAVERPKVLNARNLTVALLLHLAFAAGCYTYSVFHRRHEEKIVPIDLTVVVEENLDGREDEPPPLKKVEEPPPPPPAPPPKPKAKPKPKEPEPPKELERIVTNIVANVDRKKDEKPKPVEPEKPKKTKEELRKERMERMKKSAKLVNSKVVVKQPNGRTERKTLSDAEIRKLLNAGYRPGKTTNLATSDLQLGYSLIKMAFEAKWDRPAWTDTLKPMTIRVWFGGGGKVIRWRLEGSSGDAGADASIKSAASRVGVVDGLPAEFIKQYSSSGVPIRFTVTPQ